MKNKHRNVYDLLWDFFNGSAAVKAEEKRKSRRKRLKALEDAMAALEARVTDLHSGLAGDMESTRTVLRKVANKIDSFKNDSPLLQKLREIGGLPEGASESFILQRLQNQMHDLEALSMQVEEMGAFDERVRKLLEKRLIEEGGHTGDTAPNLYELLQRHFAEHDRRLREIAKWREQALGRKPRGGVPGVAGPVVTGEESREPNGEGV